MGAAVAFAQGDGDFGHSGFAVGIEQLGSVVDDGVVFLTSSGKEARHIDERNDGNVEAVAEAHEASRLAGSVAVKHAGIDGRLVGNHADALSVEAGEADDDVAGKVALHFQELAVIHDGTDDLIHVVCHVRIVGNNLVERIFLAVNRVGAFDAWSAFHVVLGNIGEEFANQLGKFLFAFGGEVADAGFGGVNAGAAEVFLGHLFAGDGLHDFRTGEEHVAHAFEHDDKVSECGRIDSTAGARTADAGDLGNDAACLDVALEDVAETSQGVDAFLDSCTAGVIETNAGGAHLHALIHDLANLFRHGLRERTAVDGEILSKDIDETSVDGTATGYHAIAQILFLLHAEIVAAMKFEHIHLFKGAFVEEEVDAFTCRGFAFGMLLFNGFLATAQAGFLAKLYELFDFFQLFTHIEWNVFVCSF